MQIAPTRNMDGSCEHASVEEANKLFNSNSCPELHPEMDVAKVGLALSHRCRFAGILILLEDDVEQGHAFQPLKVVLVHSLDWHSLADGLQGDDVIGLHPLRAESSACSSEHLPEQYPLHGSVSDWRQLFFAKDSPTHGALAWKSWKNTWSDLNRIFGDRTTPRDIEGILVGSRDPRVEQLAGWADYHRTNVYVNYQNLFAFRIRPRLIARGHEKAKFGRCLKIELGEEGARMYFTSQRRFYNAYNDVFVVFLAETTAKELQGCGGDERNQALSTGGDDGGRLRLRCSDSRSFAIAAQP
ncbi:hypothetical protein FGB62_271g029 [Gracilaria domingensis]|nr:hypothetical protein FGB62_271g029 [Gracilaria domingensis]